MEVMTRAITTATASFRRTLSRLGLDAEDEALGDPALFGQRAALLAAADTLWRRQVGELLELRDVQALLGVTTRQAVHDLVQRGRLLALPTRGRTAYPRFQFGANGRPYAAMARLLEVFRAVEANPWTTASWFTTEQVELDGLSPQAWLAEGRDPERLLEVARHSAASLAW
jgi:hypothetical protein